MANGTPALRAGVNGANGHAPSAYLRYLPAIYHEDAFMGQFLRIFEEILAPIQALVNALPEQFDPRVASPAMTDFLAGWVHLGRVARMPEDRWRELIRNAVWLHRWRGTKRALRRAVEIVFGQRPLISEYSEGMTLGEDATLGVNTALDSREALKFTLTFECAEDLIDRRLLEVIIQTYKPAGTVCAVVFRT
jgi:phage tail-like protein